MLVKIFSTGRLLTHGCNVCTRLQKDEDEELIKKAQEGMNAEECQFSVEFPIKQEALIWSDKYRPRKPRFFNRVHTVSSVLRLGWLFLSADLARLRILCEVRSYCQLEVVLPSSFTNAYLRYWELNGANSYCRCQLLLILPSDGLFLVDV